MGDPEEGINIANVAISDRIEPTKEIVGLTSFPDVVHRSQFVYRSHWEGIRRESTLSQLEANEMSGQYAEAAFNMVIDSLPGYIPSDVRELLKETHPVPIVTQALVNDPRRERSIDEKGPFDIYVAIPKEVAEKDHQNYIAGITILNELATDKITEDVIRYQVTATTTDLKIPMDDRKRKVVTQFSRLMNDTLSGYSIYRRRLLEVLGGDKTKSEELQVALAKSIMLGDYKETDNF